MRVKISITLAEELLKAIDQRPGSKGRPAPIFIEAAVQAFIGRSTRDEQNARDLEIINTHADLLNQEARDVLEYAQP